jgi:hypothetical protein
MLIEIECRHDSSFYEIVCVAPSQFFVSQVILEKFERRASGNSNRLNACSWAIADGLTRTAALDSMLPDH